MRNQGAPDKALRSSLSGLGIAVFCYKRDHARRNEAPTCQIAVLVDKSPIRQANYRIHWKTFPAIVYDGSCGLSRHAVRSCNHSHFVQWP
jgi:hypothetical protein